MQNVKLLFVVTFYTEDCMLHFEISFYTKVDMSNIKAGTAPLIVKKLWLSLI